MSAFSTSPGDRFRRVLRGTMVALLFAGLLGLGAAGAGASQLDQLEDLADDPFAQYDEVDEPNDPLEIPNRFIFAFNQVLDFAIVHPAAVLYRKIVPQQGRDALRNFLRNLRAPVILANDLLQGEMDRAGTTVRRFAINSTAGVLGLFDVADDMGYAYHTEDFGQTLGVHGTGEGFYIVLPLLGPSNVRDATGLVVDHFMDPWLYVADEYGKEEWLLARAALTGLDLRARNIETLDEIERDAIDFYARIRSLYGQYRENLINNGAVDSIMEPNASREEPGADQSGRSLEEDDLPVPPAAHSGTKPVAEPPAPYPDEVGIYRRVVPPSTNTQADLDAEQGRLLPEQPVVHRLVLPQPAVTQTAQPDVPPSAGTRTDLDVEQGRLLPERPVVHRLVLPQPAVTQTAQPDVPPSAGTRADLDVEQGGPLPEQPVIYRLVSPQPAATQTAQTAQTAQTDRVDPGTEYLGGLW